MFLMKSILALGTAFFLSGSLGLSQQFETPPVRSFSTTQDSNANSRLLPEGESSRQTASEFLSPSRGIPEVRVNDLRANSGSFTDSATPTTDNSAIANSSQSGTFSDRASSFENRSLASPEGQLNSKSIPDSRSFEDFPRSLSPSNPEVRPGSFSTPNERGLPTPQFNSAEGGQWNSPTPNTLNSSGQENQEGLQSGLRPLRAISETPPAINDIRDLKPWDSSEPKQAQQKQALGNQGQFSDSTTANPSNFRAQNAEQTPGGEQWYPGDRQALRGAEPRFSNPESQPPTVTDPLAHLPRLEPYRDPNVANVTYQSTEATAAPASPLTPNRLLPISDAELTQLNQPSESEYVAKFLDEFRLDSAQQPLPGMPLEIADAIRQSPPGQRIEMVTQYWNTYRAWVLLRESQTSEAQLRQISSSANNQDLHLLNAAVASASGAVREAEIDLLREQVRLQSFLYNREATDLLALPVNLPLTQNYETHYDWYAARNLVRSEHRSINQLLPQMRELINFQAAAARAHQTSIEQIVNGLKRGQTNVPTALFAHQELYKSRQRLLDAIVNYNLEISNYSLAISSFDRPPEQLAQMLVAPVRATSVNVSVNQNIANQSSPVGFRQASVPQNERLNPVPSNNGSFSSNGGMETRANSVLDSRTPVNDSNTNTMPESQQVFGGQPIEARSVGGQGSPLTPAGTTSGNNFGTNPPTNHGYGALPSSRGNQPAANNQGPVSDSPASRSFNTNEFGSNSNEGTLGNPSSNTSNDRQNPQQNPPSTPPQNIGGGGGFDPFK